MVRFDVLMLPRCREAAASVRIYLNGSIELLALLKTPNINKIANPSVSTLTQDIEGTAVARVPSIFGQSIACRCRLRIKPKVAAPPLSLPGTPPQPHNHISGYHFTKKDCLDDWNDNMILSPYHNPPYKSPTPTSPPSGPSPKRKRSDSSAQPSEPLQVQTNLRDVQETPVSGSDSPRSKVAERLGDLNIDQVNLRPPTISDDDDLERKRLKYSPKAKGRSAKRERLIPETPDHGRESMVDLFTSGRLAEIDETPPEGYLDASTPPRVAEEDSSPLQSPSRTVRVDFDDAPLQTKVPSTIPRSPRVMLSPPPQRWSSDTIPDRSLSPLQLNDDLSAIQVALTWQDSEITGHEIDYSHGDEYVRSKFIIDSLKLTGLQRRRHQRYRLQAHGCDIRCSITEAKAASQRMASPRSKGSETETYGQAARCERQRE